ncbi:malto-oligosyltrehalose synthase [Microbacterium hominis]|uniref:Malto-oligosyltrehalose synthase n=1 Tax=Microbacterium hominis TaxID=162426 RepID=A0A7D4TFC6_9MICO|nr:malto-oligosyltrehalose synthase [Microbacterium hominis]QKJ19280.1 malto-oligosyltrehalose synthase [Microbacterium hominis]
MSGARPSSTYRLQIRRAFDLDDAAAITGYLRDLGVGWVYLSPLLQATSGSDHGYDVVDPTRVDPERGGADGLARFAAAARTAGLGILVDIVPNHMGVSVPRENAWWWDVLRKGRASTYAPFFDIDWDAGDGRVLLPVLGGELGEVLADVRVDPASATADGGGGGVVRYFDHVFPLARGTVPDGADLADPATVRAVLERQHYELASWRRESAELNYRRFFGVSTLAAVRVELPEVFDATHGEIVRWIREGLADGLRVDHPDGLADPTGYLESLAEATDSAYVLVEKILEHSATDHPEALPAWWETDGTTGYDAMAEVDRVLVDPAGEAALTALDARLRSADGLPPASSWPELIHGTKRHIADTIQAAEVARLVRTLPSPVPDAADALAEILAAFPVYRSYLPAGREHLAHACAVAAARRPDLAGAITALEPMLADPRNEVARRFPQTTGPVMAKGVEDTAFYRWSTLGTLTEVGGDPSVFALDVDGFHLAQQRRQAAWPAAMTSRSTHDTKRGEDVRARITVLAEMPDRWAGFLDEVRSRASTGHGPFDALLWQAIIGSWPASRERLHAYAEKAAREAGERTTWWDPDAGFETRMHDLVDAAFDDAALAAAVADIVAEVAPPGWSNGLSAKLLQLAGPGIPDVYQGSELWETSLVDPDNRRPVDFTALRETLTRVDAGERPSIDATGAAKLLVVARTLRLRRRRPELFTRHTPMTVTGDAAGHAVAFDRGGALAVATRLPVGLARRGGWGDAELLRHRGATVDALSGRRHEGSRLQLADVLAEYPVALLVPEEDA